MITPTRPYILFSNLFDNATTTTITKGNTTTVTTSSIPLNFLKSLSLLSPKATSIKQFIYKGFYVLKPTKCEVIGYVDEIEIILDIEGSIHSILPNYFKDMQSKGFEMKNINNN